MKQVDSTQKMDAAGVYYPEDGSSRLLRIVDTYLLDYTASNSKYNYNFLTVQ
jgi:hypothetical protein